MVINNGECEYKIVEKKLFEKLKEAEEILKDDNSWMSLEELRAYVGA